MPAKGRSSSITRMDLLPGCQGAASSTASCGPGSGSAMRGGGANGVAGEEGASCAAEPSGAQLLGEAREAGGADEPVVPSTGDIASCLGLDEPSPADAPASALIGSVSVNTLPWPSV